MQVTETLAEGLRREYRVVVPAAELDAKVTERLGELKNRVRINGFRPGKVPLEHLRRIYGRAVMAEAIEAAVQEANAKIVNDRGLRLAGAPKVNLPTTEEEVRDVMAGKADLAYSVAVEILPRIDLADFKGITLERLVADVTEEEVEEAVKNIARQNRPYAQVADGVKAEPGDRVVISYVGTIDGQTFEGGSAEDVPVELGSNTFLPGFEEQLLGIAAGETRTVRTTFPANYPRSALAGKAAEFSVTAQRIERPQEVSIDDEFAKSLGLESLARLREAVKDRLQRDHAAVSRRRLKRMLLDRLDEQHKFELPPSMVEEEFNNVWQSITRDLEAQGRTFADEGTTEEKARAEYRAIAERRVRLGLVLAEIGDRNGIRVTDEEVGRAIAERARQFPGREQQIWNYYRNNPAALAAVRAPIFEEKVVDFILELATVTERRVSREELYSEENGETGETSA
jgi:trigger factor